MIRKMQATDRDIFMDMARDFYHSPAVAHPIPEEFMRRTFEEMLRSDEYLEGFLFEVEGEVAGYAILARSFSPEVGGLQRWVEEVYVRPAHQGRGLGSELLAYIEEHRESGVKRFRLEVEPDNLRAMRLYMRKGYQKLNYLSMVKDFT